MQNKFFYLKSFLYTHTYVHYKRPQKENRQKKQKKPIKFTLLFYSRKKETEKKKEPQRNK